MQNTQDVQKIARADVLLQIKKADLLGFHWNSNLQLTEISGICISQPMVLAPGPNLFLASQVPIFI